MYEDRAVQPRQIYASTLTRRDLRRTRRRGRNLLGLAYISAATIVAALTAIAAFAPGLS